MVQSTMILPFSIQNKFQDYFEGIVRDIFVFCNIYLKKISKYIK